MGRTHRWKLSLQKNLARARQNGSPYQRSIGSGVQGFTQEYYVVNHELSSQVRPRSHLTEGAGSDESAEMGLMTFRNDDDDDDSDDQEANSFGEPSSSTNVGERNDSEYSADDIWCSGNDGNEFGAHSFHSGAPPHSSSNYGEEFDSDEFSEESESPIRDDDFSHDSMAFSWSDYEDLEDSESEESESEVGEPNHNSHHLEYHQVTKRSQERRRAQYRRRIDATFEELIEIGNRELDESLTKKMMIKMLIEKFGDDVQSIMQQQIDKQVDDAAAARLIEKFRQTPKRSHKRVVIASRMFDVDGNLLFFSSQKIARASLGCCRQTYQRARQHARIFGPGASRSAHKRKTQTPVRQILHQLEIFAENKMAVRISSFQTTTSGQPISYLTETITALWRTYQREQPNGVGRSMFFKFFSNERFQRMELLGGLCSVCDATAYCLRQSVIKLTRHCCPTQEKDFLKRIDSWIRHIRLQMMPTIAHSACVSHCYSYAIGLCTEEHNLECNECLNIFQIIDDLRPLIFIQNQNDLLWVLFQDLPRMATGFMGHRFRTSSAKHIHAQTIEAIPEQHCVIILDFKQKLLKASSREPQSDFFAKKAFASLHGAAILTRETEAQRQSRRAQEEATVVRHRKPSRVRATTTRRTTEVNVQFVDIFSKDTVQDTQWVMQAIELICIHMTAYLPQITTLEIWTDNASNYHNTELLRFCPLIFRSASLNLQKFRFFEAGEGKSLLDRHFATVRHGILRRLINGNPFEGIDDIRAILQELSSVHSYELTPERSAVDQLSLALPKIKAISTFHDWRFHHREDQVEIRCYKDVFGGTPVGQSHHTEVIQLLQPSYNMNLPNTLKLTGGRYVQNERAEVVVLPPLSEPKQFLIDASSFPPFQPLRQQSLQYFGSSWGQPLQRRVNRYPPMIVRALQYFFHVGNNQAGAGGAHLGPEAICDSLSLFIREGRINERALTVTQIRSWVGREKTKNRSRPTWIVPGDPSCIWTIPLTSSEAVDVDDDTHMESSLRPNEMELLTESSATYTLPATSSEVPAQQEPTIRLLQRWFLSRERQQQPHPHPEP